KIETFPFVRTPGRAMQLEAKITEKADLVVYTIMNGQVVDIIKQICEKKGIRAVPLLDPLFQAFDTLNKMQRNTRPGMQYNVDQEYLERVTALDYAISHDDGLSAGYLKKADVILVGVSRTSKTPTCIFLAYQGIRAANVPLVPGQDIPEGLKEALAAGVPAVGLIASPSRLMQVRQHRLQSLGRTEIADYVDKAEIHEELTSARLLFDKYNLPVIDVTRRSIEETTAAIRDILANRT
ncbi:MAG TPA: pyruvate, water dikinase regulatory protein, partial [Paracoccaceae bacterium]|nr:pyruvate, water dikinase regulatory protein [Paracoccaceae bacterium]